MMRSGILALVMLAAAFDAAAAAQPRPATEGTPAAATAARALQEISLDGLDADATWSGAQTVRGFRQFDPELDAEPAHPTEFKVAYDADNLYVFVRAFDAAPDSI